MNLPLCPTCRQGHLIPISSIDVTFAFWTCSDPECAYVVSASPAAVTFYKGSAVAAGKEKGEKRWTEFQF